MPYFIGTEEGFDYYYERFHLRQTSCIRPRKRDRYPQCQKKRAELSKMNLLIDVVLYKATISVRTGGHGGGLDKSLIIHALRGEYFPAFDMTNGDASGTTLHYIVARMQLDIAKRQSLFCSWG